MSKHLELPELKEFKERVGHDPYKIMVRDIPSDSNLTRAGEGQGEEG